RVGCALHVLHIAVNAGLENDYFMGPLGKGSWQDWQYDHLVSLLGVVWYNLSRSSSSNSKFRQYQHMIAKQFPD
ncbi:unnamed protein product, partial [Laminaria digitata]